MRVEKADTRKECDGKRSEHQQDGERGDRSGGGAAPPDQPHAERRDECQRGQRRRRENGEAGRRPRLQCLEHGQRSHGEKQKAQQLRGVHRRA
jgi:hypothetical protein